MATIIPQSGNGGGTELGLWVPVYSYFGNFNETPQQSHTATVNLKRGDIITLGDFYNTTNVDPKATHIEFTPDISNIITYKNTFPFSTEICNMFGYDITDACEYSRIIMQNADNVSMKVYSIPFNSSYKNIPTVTVWRYIIPKDIFITDLSINTNIAVKDTSAGKYDFICVAVSSQAMIDNIFNNIVLETYGTASSFPYRYTPRSGMYAELYLNLVSNNNIDRGGMLVFNKKNTNLNSINFKSRAPKLVQIIT